MPDILEMTLTSPLNETPTLTVSYPVAGGVRGDLLDGEVELAVEYTPDNGGSWVEPPSARFVTTKVERNLLADGTESRRVCTSATTFRGPWCGILRRRPRTRRGSGTSCP
jgi:hypothetical protein